MTVRLTSYIRCLGCPLRRRYIHDEYMTNEPSSERIKNGRALKWSAWAQWNYAGDTCARKSSPRTLYSYVWAAPHFHFSIYVSATTRLSLCRACDPILCDEMRERRRTRTHVSRALTVSSHVQSISVFGKYSVNCDSRANTSELLSRHRLRTSFGIRSKCSATDGYSGVTCDRPNLILIAG